MTDWALERDLVRTAAAVARTRTRIAPYIRHTPVVELDETRLAKLETLQRGGSFKVRGAASAITAAPGAREVVAASTGNHGIAVAQVAGELGLPCRVFVPSGAEPAKLARLRATAVELVAIDGDPLQAELAARASAGGTTGALLVPPYNDPEVVLGQATIGLELIDAVTPPPDVLFAPVGGGGLLSGIALAVRERWPGCRIAGCLPAASPAMADAVAAGHAVTSRVLPTLADATAGNIEPDAITIPICAALVDEFVLLEEDELAAAMGTALREHHLVIEGAAALALAASLRAPRSGRHLIVLSGAGVGLDALRAIV